MPIAISESLIFDKKEYKTAIIPAAIQIFKMKAPHTKQKNKPIIPAKAK